MIDYKTTKFWMRFNPRNRGVVPSLYKTPVLAARKSLPHEDIVRVEIKVINVEQPALGDGDVV